MLLQKYFRSGSRSLRPTAVTSPLCAKAVIRARIARVDSPTSSAICCEDNPEFLPAEVDKAARIFCVTSSSSGSCSGTSEIVARKRNANSSKTGSGNPIFLHSPMALRIPLPYCSM